MKRTRRSFLGAATATGVLAPLGLPAPEAASRPRSERQTTADDPLGVRSDFPVVERGIYLNSAYITPSPRPVIDAGNAFWEAKASAPISLGEMLAETTRVRERFARLIGAEPPEIGILDATSAGENIVAASLDLAAGDNIVVDDLHYETTYALYRQLERTRGIDLRIVRSGDGAATASEFAGHVDQRTRLVSVAWVSHRNGYAHDLRELADLAHSHGAYLYADAIQGIGMLPLDVRDVGIDFLAAGTYKWLLGGYGVAPFFVRRELIPRVQPDRAGSLNIARELPDFHFELYEDAEKYLYATPAFGAIYQLGAALDYLHEIGVDRIAAHTIPLAQRLATGLASQGHVVLTPPGNGSSIVSFEHSHDPTAVAASLERAGIQVSLREEGRQLRVGVALFNNSADIDRLLELTATWSG